MTRHFLRASAAVALTAGVVAAGMPPPALATRAANAAHPRPRTMSDLDSSLHGEAFANVAYTYYAAQAWRDAQPRAARLFADTARTELEEHFAEEAALSGLVGGDVDNLRAAITGETYEWRMMYPTFARQARADGELAAAALFSDIAKDEGSHRRLYLAALRALRVGGRIPMPPRLDAKALLAGLPRIRAARTRANVAAALRGEAFAYARYTFYARHAARAGHTALARLFAGVAAVERREHFPQEARLAGLVAGTRANLGQAIAGETYESRRMYPSFASRATAVGDQAAARVFWHNAADEARHARAFARARLTLRRRS